MSKSLYDILGVPRTASEAEIVKAYRKLAKTCHPDLHPGDRKAEERFKQLSSAYDVLGDKEKRARYDRGEIDEQGKERGFDPSAYWQQRHGRSPGGGRFEQRVHTSRRGGGLGFDDILNDLFNMGGKRGAKAGAAPSGPGEDLRLPLTLDFLDAARGGSRRVTLPGGSAIDVTIPAGIETGAVLRLRGKGRRGPGGAGDALVEITVQPHARFSRKGADIQLDQPVPLATAVLGGKVRVPTIDGEVSLSIPKGSSSGRTLRLKGKGVRDGKTGLVGDQLVRILVELPDPADTDLVRALESWAKARSPAAA
jgi:DnaJ-class molecular chaperone